VAHVYYDVFFCQIVDKEEVIQNAIREANQSDARARELEEKLKAIRSKVHSKTCI
jgi:hypothetical protein